MNVKLNALEIAQQTSTCSKSIGILENGMKYFQIQQ